MSQTQDIPSNLQKYEEVWKKLRKFIKFDLLANSGWSPLIKTYYITIIELLVIALRNMAAQCCHRCLMLDTG